MTCDSELSECVIVIAWGQTVGGDYGEEGREGGGTNPYAYETVLCKK